MIGLVALTAPAWADDAPPARLSDMTGNEVVWSDAVESESVDFIEEPSPIAALRFFTNKDEFTRAAEAAGKRVKCSEDFEGSNLPPNSVLGFADPLQGGVPNGPYPNGLACRNLTVQSNLGGGNAPQPNPRGANGLAAASAGFLGATSDIVLANTFVDSLDHIYSDECCKTAIGANVLNHVAANVTIKVYSVGNVLLGQQDFPGNIQGTNFFGVISDADCIGRINLFQAANGAEGLDNVSMWCRGEPQDFFCEAVAKKVKRKACEQCPPLPPQKTNKSCNPPGPNPNQCPPGTKAKGKVKGPCPGNPNGACIYKKFQLNGICDP
jgi:hypothetical protein